MKKFYELLRLLWNIVRCEMGASEMNTTGISELDAAIPEFWAEGILADGNRESFWGSLAGKEGSRMPIVDKPGPLKEKGDQLSFNTIAQLMGTGVTGETRLRDTEEAMAIGTFTVSVDVVRHAVGVTWKATRQANYGVIKSAGGLLKEWMTRKMDNDIFTTILTDDNIETLYAGSTAGDVNDSTDDLNSADGDYFGIGEIELIRMALIRQGALPLKVNKVNGRSIPIYGIVFGEIEDFRLSQNTIFMSAIKDALERFKGAMGSHPLFSGALGIYRNMLLYPYYSALPIPQGTPLRPETTVATTLTVGETSTLTVGTTAASVMTVNVPDFTLFFATSGTLQIEEEILTYTAATNNTFTTVGRGASSTTAAEHAAGALVTQRNIASVIGFGAEAVYRAIGDSPKPIGQKDDYGDEIGLGVKAYYGQAMRTDARRGKTPNAVVLKCYSENPGLI